ncbi:alpha/beta hydrolase [Flavobacteriales bacterium 34_180_T64]|nr:alpha/beta hydrolase [Flavobacteriales bacterium 34_180_T64]
MKLSLNLLLLLFVWKGIAQESNFTSNDISINSHVEGTLLTPIADNEHTLAILIAGSGPTDRNGNQNFLKNNSLKKLAEGLTSKGISTFRFDKRIVKQIRTRNIDKTIMFDDFVTDATSVIDYFKSKSTYSKIYVIGHSQGSLVGMLASKGNVDGFVSIAGTGQPIDSVILEQVGNMDPGLYEPTAKVFNSLRDGQTTTDYPAALVSVFNIDTQPFIMNWMQYDPTAIIKTLDMPILVINGSKDLQITKEEAQRLADASDNADLQIITNMNHVLFLIEGDDLENSKSYNESFRAISEELITLVSAFIKD